MSASPRAGPLAATVGLWPPAVGWCRPCPAAGLAVGRWIGDLLWWLLPGRRRRALDNIHLSLGREMTPREIERLGRRSFQHLGMNLIEACRYFLRPTEVMLSQVHVEGVEHLQSAAARGWGRVRLSAV
jgi:lauroyl/myristoyl acyltransferase